MADRLLKQSDNQVDGAGRPTAQSVPKYSTASQGCQCEGNVEGYRQVLRYAARTYDCRGLTFAQRDRARRDVLFGGMTVEE